jgi:hypothetical protein
MIRVFPKDFADMISMVLDQFHNKVGPSAVGRTGVKNFGSAERGARPAPE